MIADIIWKRIIQLGYIKTKFLRVTEYHKQIFYLKRKELASSYICEELL